MGKGGCYHLLKVIRLVLEWLQLNVFSFWLSTSLFFSMKIFIYQTLVPYNSMLVFGFNSNFFNISLWRNIKVFLIAEAISCLTFFPVLCSSPFFFLNNLWVCLSLAAKKQQRYQLAPSSIWQGRSSILQVRKNVRKMDTDINLVQWPGLPDRSVLSWYSEISKRFLSNGR